MNGFNWGLPQNISINGAKIDVMMSTLHWFMLLLFVFWGAFFVYCLFAFRARPGHKAVYEPIHATWSKYLEIGVAIFEAVLLVGFSMPVWAAFKANDVPPAGQSTQVRIVAQQFAWNFWYPGPDGKFGKSDINLIDNSNPLGIDPNDPDGKDDVVVLNQLYIPEDKPVYAWITSKDVIHSFGVPNLRIRQDAIPGMNIPIHFQVLPGSHAVVGGKDPLSGQDEPPGDFDIACSQLCGNGHGRMRAVLHAMAPAAYAKWMADKQAELFPPAVETPAPTATPSASPAGSPAKAAASPAKPAATPATSPAK